MGKKNVSFLQRISLSLYGINAVQRCDDGFSIPSNRFHTSPSCQTKLIFFSSLCLSLISSDCSSPDSAGYSRVGVTLTTSSRREEVYTADSRRCNGWLNRVSPTLYRLVLLSVSVTNIAFVDGRHRFAFCLFVNTACEFDRRNLCLHSLLRVKIFN